MNKMKATAAARWGGASMLALAALLPVTAMAQTADQGGQLEEIIVTGIRAQVQSAQAIKQNANQIVDSVTATDIGALPDRSVTEVLQRIPGITIGRTADGRDADRISVEGSGVQIRGLSMVRGEFNGRDAFGARNGRALGFEDVPPELMAGVDVYKNPSADRVEGGLGGTVNLRTRTPFDAKGRVIAGSADYSYADLRKKGKPSYSLLYSDRWEHNKLGEFGVLFDVSDSKLSTRADTFSVNPYRERVGMIPGAEDKDQPAGFIAGVPQGKTVYVPDGWGYRTLDFERERFGLAGVVQWRPDNRWDITLQYLRSAAEQAALEHVVGVNTGSANGPAKGTNFTYDANGYFVKGTISNAADGTGTTHDIDLLDARWNRRYSVTQDASLNLKFAPTDAWSFEGDVQYVKSTTKSIDFTMFDTLPGNSALPAATLDLTGGLPKVTMAITDAYRSNPANYYYSAAMDNHQANEADQWAERFDAEYTFDDDWLSSARFGVRHNKREATTRDSNYNWGWISQTWTGEGVSSLDKSTKIPYVNYGSSNFMRGAITQPGVFLVPDGTLAKNYVDAAKAVLATEKEPSWGGGWRPFNGDYEAQTGNGGGVNHQSEETWAAYAMTSFANTLNLFGGAKDVDGNVGVRYIHTKTRGTGLSIVPSASSLTLGPNTAANILAFFNGTRTNFEGGRTYDYFLPTFNLRVKLTDELQWRVSAGRSIVRPDLQQLSPTFNLAATAGQIVGGTCQTGGSSGGNNNCIYQYTGSAGNPDLKPVRSNQYDMSLEWYFAPTGSLTGAAFYKDVYGFVTTTLQTVDFTNNGVTNKVLTNQPYNAGHGTIKGFEIAYSQFYDNLPGLLSGLGFQGNLTYVDAKGTRNAAVNPYDTNQLANIKGSTNLPLEGMSKWAYNLQALYSYDPVELRLAWNWRKRYLLTTTAANINIPAWSDDYGQLDASAFYSINEHVKAGVEAANLSNSRTKILVGFPGKLTMHNWVDADRRYTFVLRATY